MGWTALVRNYKLLTLVRGDRPRPSLLAQPLLFVIRCRHMYSYTPTPQIPTPCTLPSRGVVAYSLLLPSRVVVSTTESELWLSKGLGPP